MEGWYLKFPKHKAKKWQYSHQNNEKKLTRALEIDRLHFDEAQQVPTRRKRETARRIQTFLLEPRNLIADFLLWFGQARRNLPPLLISYTLLSKQFDVGPLLCWKMHFRSFFQDSILFYLYFFRSLFVILCPLVSFLVRWWSHYVYCCGRRSTWIVRALVLKRCGCADLYLILN